MRGFSIVSFHCYLPLPPPHCVYFFACSVLLFACRLLIRIVCLSVALATIRQIHRIHSLHLLRVIHGTGSVKTLQYGFRGGYISCDNAKAILAVRDCTTDTGGVCTEGRDSEAGTDGACTTEHGMTAAPA